MIILNKITDKLVAVLGGAITTNQLPVIVSYDDFFPNGRDENRSLANTNDTNDVDICPSPSAGTTRNIAYVSVYNKDTVNATVTIKYDDNGTQYIMLSQVLAPGETLQYNDGSGWVIF